MRINYSNRKKGFIAENRAAKYLADNGFELIDKNYYTPYGEIDIVAKKDNVLHFIEVKSGRNFNPLLNITERKMSRLCKSVLIYLSKNNLDSIYCIDVISIQNEEISFISNVSYMFDLC